MQRLFFTLSFLFFLSSRLIAQQAEHDFNPVTLIRKPFEAITNVKSYPADHERVDVAADELVIGIDIGGQSRAYPVNMLNGPYREIINDSIGEIGIAATW